MRVVMNGLSTLRPKTGVGHHVVDLHAALRTHFLADEFALYPGETLGRAAHSLKWLKSTDDRPAGSAPSFGRRVMRDLKRLGKGAAQVAARMHFAAYTRAFGFDLYHEPNFVPFPTRLPTVVTVHDLSVLKFPQWHPADRVAYHQRFFLRGLDRAKHIIVVSEAVRRELIEELGCPPDRVTAVHNGVGPQFVPQSPEVLAAVRRKWKLPDSFFLCVGTIEPRKNLGAVLRAFIDLPAEVRSACPLVLVGPWGWRSEPDREIYETVGRAAGVRHIGYLPTADLPGVYAAARVLLYPSHYEGFGFPPVEMLACGGAVIASTADAVREVVGEHARYVEQEDHDGWRAVMGRAARDDEFIARLAHNGVCHAAKYTWQRAAEETAAVYRHVLARTAPTPPPATPSSSLTA